jgi:signal transduction histidine kinase
MISRQVIRMSEVIQNILIFARGDRALDYYEVDPNEAIENVFSMIGRQLKLHDISGHKQIDPSLPRIGMSMTRLEQVIMKLVVNACRLWMNAIKWKKPVDNYRSKAWTNFHRSGR